MKRRTALPLLLASAVAFACAAFGPKPFASEGEYRRWLGGLQISGVTAQAATLRLRDEGFTCQTTSGVIRDAPGELVIVCTRRAAESGCTQDQTVVLRLDWVGAMKPETAPGMRVRDVGPALGKRDCG